MIKRYSYKNLVWVDMEKPTREEVTEVANEFSIPALVAEELSRPSLKGRVELLSNFIYLILRFPAVTRVNQDEIEQEIDFVIGKKFIVTAHYAAADPLLQFSKIFEVNSILDKTNLGDHAGFIFFYMMRELYRSMGDELAVLSSQLSEVEKKTFGGHEREMVNRLSRLSRTFLHFKKSLGSHQEMLESFEIAGRKFFGEAFAYELRSIKGEYFKTRHELDSLKDFLSEIRETNDSLLATKQNEITRILTVVAFIGVPLTILSSLFQINTRARPVVGGPNDFWIILGAEIVIALILLIYFRIKKWL